MIQEIDLKHLKRCIELAKNALDAGDEPFGSILVAANGEVLAEDQNHVSGVTIHSTPNLHWHVGQLKI